MHVVGQLLIYTKPTIHALLSKHNLYDKLSLSRRVMSGARRQTV
jgi:hypothetical protein